MTNTVSYLKWPTEPGSEVSDVPEIGVEGVKNVSEPSPVLCFGKMTPYGKASGEKKTARTNLVLS